MYNVYIYTEATYISIYVYDSIHASVRSKHMNERLSREKERIRVS